MEESYTEVDEDMMSSSGDVMQNNDGMHTEIDDLEQVSMHGNETDLEQECNEGWCDEGVDEEYEDFSVEDYNDEVNEQYEEDMGEEYEYDLEEEYEEEMDEEYEEELEEEYEEVVNEELGEQFDELSLVSRDVLFGREALLIEDLNDVLSLHLNHVGLEEISRCLFSSLDVAYVFYNWYARLNGFVARKSKILRNTKGQLLQQTFVCNKQGYREDRGAKANKRKRHPRGETRCGCEAKCRVHIHFPSQLWYVSCFEDEHNHPFLSDLQSGMAPSHRRMEACDIMQMNSFAKAGIGPADMFHLMGRQCGGYEKVGYWKKDMYNQIQRQRQLRGSDGASAIKYLHSLSSNDPNMFVRHTVDEEDRLQHVFWCDGRSQYDYEVFGDVLAFDATYGKNKYRCPVVIFSGVNNHNQTIVFAAALIANELEETYVWLLEQLVEAMKGKCPNAVITDGDMAMRNAIKKIFPNSHHRLCAWHLMRNVTSNTGNTSFVAEFEKLMFGDFSIGQFKRKWKAVVSEHGLQENKWVNDIYEKREMWATSCIRGTFFAGFRTTSRCEGLHAQLGKFVKSRYNLTDFVEHFQRLIYYMRYKEMLADFKCDYEKPQCETEFYSLEISGAKMFTREIFKRFREVLRSSTLSRVVDTRHTIDHIIYKVVKYKVLGKVWWVSHYPLDNDFKCCCQRMETYGLPCVHIMAVLVHLHIGVLPDCLVLERWTIDVKDCFVGLRTDDCSFWESHVIARYVWLMNACREFCTLACQSGDDFADAREKIRNEVQLLKDNGRDVATGGVERCVDALKDPAYAKTKGKYGKKVSLTTLKTKRTIKCSACKVQGHNKLTCSLLKQSNAAVDNVSASSSFESSKDGRSDTENFNVDVIGG